MAAAAGHAPPAQAAGEEDNKEERRAESAARESMIFLRHVLQTTASGRWDPAVVNAALNMALNPDEWEESVVGQIMMEMTQRLTTEFDKIVIGVEVRPALLLLPYCSSPCALRTLARRVELTRCMPQPPRMRHMCT